MIDHDASKASADALRKVAILVAALDTASADVLLQRMGSERAELVRNTILQLGPVAEQEERMVLDEFMRAGGAARDDDHTGIELDGSLAQKLASPPAAPAEERQADDQTETVKRPFQFLQTATTDQLARHLRGEHPQLIAVVVAHLSAPQAAELIKRLSPPLQVNVLRRVAELDATDPEILADVERELKLLLTDPLDATSQQAAGLTAVATILEAAGAERSELLDNVRQHDKTLAVQLGQTAPTPPQPAQAGVTPAASTEQPLADKRWSQSDRASTPRVTPGSRAATNRSLPAAQPAARLPAKQADLPQIEFAALARLETASLATLFREVEPQITLLALVGADAAFLDQILQQFPAREAKSLRRKLQAIGPLKLADIERAQQHVARRAAELVAAGRLHLPEPKRFAMAA